MIPVRTTVIQSCGLVGLSPKIKKPFGSLTAFSSSPSGLFESSPIWSGQSLPNSNLALKISTLHVLIDSPLEAIRRAPNVDVLKLFLLSALDFKIAKCGPRPANCGTLTVTAGREKGCTVDRSKSKIAKANVDVLDIVTQLSLKSHGKCY